jgi:hypothetical protein
MPNAIKYNNVSVESLSLKQGNFYIGTGDVAKGPTSNTGFYNGITPPSGGFTIYLNKTSNGPSIYTVTTEAQMVSLTNSIGSQSFTTSGQCINWFATQTDKMIFDMDYPSIITNGLTYCVDAGFSPSYPTINTSLYNVANTLSPSSILYNGVGYNSGSGGYLTFDGVDDYTDVFDVSYRLGLAGKNNSSTFCVVFRPTDGAAANGSTWFYAGCADGNCYGTELFRSNTYSAGLRTMGTYYYDNNNAIGPYLFVQMQFTNNAWNVLQVTYNSDGSYFFSLNGALATATALNNINGTTYNVPASGTAPSFSSWNTNRPDLILGGAGNYGYDTSNIALSYVYNVGLTLAQHTQNYNALKGRFGLS